MALPKEAVGQHKRMAMGEKDVGFKKGGAIETPKKGSADANQKGKAEGFKRGGSIETPRKGSEDTNREGKAEGFKRGGHVSHVHPSGRMKKNGGKC